MTARADAAPACRSVPGLPRAGGTAPTPDVEASRASAAARLVARLLAVLRPAFRARPPSAGGLTDRQLADIGLTRGDLPDGRGWRR